MSYIYVYCTKSKTDSDRSVQFRYNVKHIRFEFYIWILLAECRFQFALRNLRTRHTIWTKYRDLNLVYECLQFRVFCPLKAIKMFIYSRGAVVSAFIFLEFCDWLKAQKYNHIYIWFLFATSWPMLMKALFHGLIETDFKIVVNFGMLSTTIYK